MMLNKAAKENRNYIFGIGVAIAVVLLALNWFLNSRIDAAKKELNKNFHTLNEAMPNFNDNSLNQLKQELNDLKVSLIGLSSLFDPKDKWLKKDYDFSIYFIEELGNANQSLKTKAAGKQLNFTDLGFKEKLPDAQEAIYLLSQLYGLKETVSLGMDFGVNFKSIIPLSLEESREETKDKTKAPAKEAIKQEQIDGIKIVRSNLDMDCPGNTLIEFILQLNEIVPKVCFESLLLKSIDSRFAMSLAMENVVVEINLEAVQGASASGAAKIKEPSIAIKEERDFARTLRGASPFFIPVEKKAPLAPQKQETAPVDQAALALARFAYRGRAVLRSKDVVVIEDTLNQETLFLGRDERIGDFTVQDFSDDQVILKDKDDDKELVVRRTEK